MTRILLVPGSTPLGSLHFAALRTAARFAPEGITATVYEGLRELPAFVPGEQSPGPVADLRQAVRAADALLFCSPEYAGSLPGSLKNLLDWLADGGNLTGKTVAWLSVAPLGQDDGALQTLQTVLEYAEAKLLRSACVRIPLTMADVEHGVVTDARLHMALQDMIGAFARRTEQASKQSQPSWQVNSSLFPLVLPRDPFRK